ncbi:MAG: flavodoxin-dependent (E)-4-hydroxy-3-methylbut-2-enyl-diphosphate synthase [Clostridia bacterium]|nr:flavodoxin-dependent (E)-4-hydroxy-3-methylbut-2-enyl-diphosphate synthase [Clostridia bacterium]
MIYNEIRRKTKKLKIGNIYIGGDSPIAIQSMTNTDTCDKEATLAQILELQAAGCDIVRITVPTLEAAETIPYLKENGVYIPIVADIHFDYKIALKCAELLVDKIRINPGNIGSDDKVKAVADACKKRNIPIRIGINSGSLQKDILQKYGSPTPEALCESAFRHIELLEKCDFHDIVVSIKASNVPSMIKVNKLLAERCDYNIHLGVTEAGSEELGTLKSAVGIGSLLCEGIGDTVRVSLTADPVLEIAAAKKILSAVEIEGQSGMKIVSCPTCGRTKIDLIDLVHRFEDAVKREGLEDKPIKVAIMGCAVNGPGEAREADIGIAGGIGEGLLFAHGEIIEKIPEDKIIDTLIQRIKEL